MLCCLHRRGVSRANSDVLAEFLDRPGDEKIIVGVFDSGIVKRKNTNRCEPENTHNNITTQMVGAAEWRGFDADC